jgi:hypothetical protein
MNNKDQLLGLVRSNIERYGFHITIVTGGVEPRYAYTIGLSEKFNFELIFAGGIYYLQDDLFRIFNKVAEVVTPRDSRESPQKITIDTLGDFTLSDVDSSWSKLMMLGMFDYYNTTDATAFQIIPDSIHYTLDIPHMKKKLDASSDPVWQWLVKAWHYDVPENSTVVTNIDALQGKPITEIMRWEQDEWEMFAGAGPDVEEKDIRVASIGTIIGIDKSLFPALNLDIGKGLWRNSHDSDWVSWG